MNTTFPTQIVRVHQVYQLVRSSVPITVMKHVNVRPYGNLSKEDRHILGELLNTPAKGDILGFDTGVLTEQQQGEQLLFPGDIFVVFHRQGIYKLGTIKEFEDKRAKHVRMDREMVVYVVRRTDSQKEKHSGTVLAGSAKSPHSKHLIGEDILPATALRLVSPPPKMAGKLEGKDKEVSAAGLPRKRSCPSDPSGRQRKRVNTENNDKVASLKHAESEGKPRAKKTTQHDPSLHQKPSTVAEPPCFPQKHPSSLPISQPSVPQKVATVSPTKHDVMEAKSTKENTTKDEVPSGPLLHEEPKPAAVDVANQSTTGAVAKKEDKKAVMEIFNDESEAIEQSISTNEGKPNATDSGSEEEVQVVRVTRNWEEATLPTIVNFLLTQKPTFIPNEHGLDARLDVLLKDKDEVQKTILLFGTRSLMGLVTFQSSIIQVWGWNILEAVYRKLRKHSCFDALTEAGLHLHLVRSLQSVSQCKTPAVLEAILDALVSPLMSSNESMTNFVETPGAIPALLAILEWGALDSCRTCLVFLAHVATGAKKEMLSANGPVLISQVMHRFQDDDLKDAAKLALHVLDEQEDNG